MDCAVGILALLEKGYEKTGKGGAGTIQGVAEVVSPLGIFVAKFHTARLIVTKARAARHFEIFSLAGSPDLDVIGLTGAKADVAGAEFDNLIMKAKLLESSFGMAGELF